MVHAHVPYGCSAHVLAQGRLTVTFDFDFDFDFDFNFDRVVKGMQGSEGFPYLFPALQARELIGA